MKRTEKSSERTMKHFFTLPEPKSKKEVMKTLKELGRLSIEMQITVPRN